jgi:hypothetical protein
MTPRDFYAEADWSNAPVGPVAPLAPVRNEGWDTPVEPPAQVAPVSKGGVPVTGAAIVDRLQTWFTTYICTMTDRDLELLALWTLHTHLVLDVYTSPRLLIDSPVPGSGKTTVLEHLGRLCFNPVQMASVGSPALLTRMLDAGMRTILIDEADRSLNPDRDGVQDLFAVLNSGYKRGGKRPVLVPQKGGGWDVAEMPTYSPVAMAGNNPNLPEDTRSRTIRVLLMPDIDGVVSESDWEVIEEEAFALADDIAVWADTVRDAVRLARPDLPEGVTGRARERWASLMRIASVVGGRWPAAVTDMAEHEKEQLEMDKEDGMIRDRPHVLLLKHLHDIWPKDETFLSTSVILTDLTERHPEHWGASSPFGKPLTAQRLGRMLAQSFGINSTRLDRTGPRGYSAGAVEPAWRRLGVTPSIKPAQLALAAQPAQETTSHQRSAS